MILILAALAGFFFHLSKHTNRTRDEVVKINKMAAVAVQTSASLFLAEKF
jgi:hypothetical protein